MGLSLNVKSSYLRTFFSLNLSYFRICWCADRKENLIVTAIAQLVANFLFLIFII